MKKQLVTDDPAPPANIKEYSRRAFLINTGVIGLGLCLNPINMFGQNEGLVDKIRREAGAARITKHYLRGNVYMLEGSGGNILVFSGKDGKLLVDAGIDLSKPEITKALSGISNAPVRQLINTHWHFDHTDGNEWLHKEGAVITAHENTRKHLSSTVTVKPWGHTFHPVPKGAMPEKVFKNDLSIDFNSNIDLKYFQPAHTDGDISVHFTDQDILHVGDTWWNAFYPFIDYDTGGSIDGMIRATEINLKNAGNKTLIIPGHGPVGSRNELIEFRNMLSVIRNNVYQLKKQGKTLKETIAAKPSQKYDAKYGGFLIDGASFISLVYKGV